MAKSMDYADYYKMLDKGGAEFSTCGLACRGDCEGKFLPATAINYNVSCSIFEILLFSHSLVSLFAPVVLVAGLAILIFWATGDFQ